MLEGTEMVSVFVVRMASSGKAEDAGQMGIVSAHWTITSVVLDNLVYFHLGRDV